jgi:hypothetical protein
MPPAFVAILTFAFAICIPASALYYRHKRAELTHAERMAALEKGVALPVFEPLKPAADPIRRYLLAGMIWLFSGAALSFFLFALSVTQPKSDIDSLQERQAKVEALRKLGASDEELRRVVIERGGPGGRMPVGMGAIGLIPMGVGLAYLIFYTVERKRFGPPQ